MTKYWENLGLSFDPFDPNEEINPCFLSEQWLYLLDLILELSNHSHAVLSVVAPSGGGKSTLAKVFMSRLEANGVCHIRGDQSISVDFLRYLLAKHLGVAYAENQLEQFNRQLASKLEQMAKNRQQFHIVIDDAHLLPERTLAGLLTLAARQPSEFPPVHMVFFGSLPLETTLSDILARYHLDVVTHTTRIKSFDVQATKQYIAHCLKIVGYTGDFPLTDDEVGQIHNDSEGLPGLINQHVVGYLHQRRLRYRQIPEAIHKLVGKPSWKLSNRQWISAFGLFVLIGTAFMVVNHPIKHSTPSPVTIATADAVLPPEVSDSVQNEFSEHETVYSSDHSNIFSETNEPSKTVLSEEPVEQIAEIPGEKSDEKSEVLQSEFVEVKPVVVDKKEPMPQPSENQISPLPRKTTAQPKMVNTSYSVHEKNLLSRDPSHYTLQLMGAYDKSPLTKFIEKAHLLTDAWYFHTWHQHKHWYVVVYGDYATHQDAELAMKQLPESVLQQKPWVRTIASVQSAISKDEKTA